MPWAGTKVVGVARSPTAQLVLAGTVPWQVLETMLAPSKPVSAAVPKVVAVVTGTVTVRTGEAVLTGATNRVTGRVDFHRISRATGWPVEQVRRALAANEVTRPAA